MDLQGLRSALERLFDLPGLLALTRDDLAIDPAAIGPGGGGEASDVASFARALTLHCARTGQLAALTDAAVAWFPDARLTFAALRNDSQASSALEAGSAFGPFEVKEHLGTGPTGHSYRALFNDRSVRLKVFHQHASVDREALHRVQTQTRLQRRLPHCGLPQSPQAGSVGEQPFIAHDWFPGESVAQRLANAGPQSPEWMRDLLAALLSSVNALHEIGLCAACIKPDNVLFSETDQGLEVILLDVGVTLLHGASASAEQDFHDLGALAYQILSGTEPTTGNNELTPKPNIKPPSSAGQAHFDAPQVDRLVLDLLSHSMDSKLNASSLRETVLQLDLSGGESQISVVDLQTRMDALLGNPLSSEALADVEQALTLGASRASVGSAIFQAAETAAQQQPGASGTVQLYIRAAELLANASQFTEAETALQRSKALSPDFLPNAALFERICRGLNKLDTLIEGLLERSDAEPSKTARATLLGKIADIYDRELRDQEQALVAYTQALCEYPSEPRYGLNVERIAGQSLAHWEEVLLACSQATAQLEPSLSRALLLQMGKWYARLAQVDLAVACYKAVLEQNASDLAACSALDQLYRNNQQWTELHSLLLAQVQQVMDPEREQSLRCQVAEIAETRLSDPHSAQGEYAKVLSINPAHDGAYQGLTRLLERSGDFAGVVLAQQQRAKILHGTASAALYCQAASLCIAQLKDLGQAKELYQAAFDQDPHSLHALQGLESIFAQQKQFDQLIGNLKQQLGLVATPRARVDLLFRIAGLYDREFLDHEQAAQALEELLALDFSHTEARTALLRQYRSLGRFEPVASLLERVARETDDPEQRLAALIATAQLFENDVQDQGRAIGAYEAVLAVSPSHAEALAALAKLRESTGDAQAALQAVLALAEKANNPAEKLPHLLRAGQLYLSARDYRSACDQFRSLLDIDPGNGSALNGLRDALMGLGDARGIVALIEQQLTRTDGNHAKAKLLLELATLLNAQVGDKAGATNAVKRALELDPTLSAALLLSADIAYESQQYREASSSYQKLLGQSASLAPDVARRVLLRQIDALTRLDSASAAAQLIDPLLKVAAGDAQALLVAASLSFEHGSPEQTAQLCTLLLSEHASALDSEQTALWTFRLGESQRRMGAIDQSIATLEEAADLDHDAKGPLESLALAQAAQGNWEAVVRSKERLLDLTEGAERADLLVELGDVINDKLGDRTRAVKSFTAALEVRPDNRKLLTRLMALYSESREWLKLLDVVAQLASLVESAEQKSKYLLTAAMVCQRELDELERAADLYSQVLSLDPGNKKAQDEALKLFSKLGRFEAVEQLLTQNLERAQASGSNEELLNSFLALGSLYQNDLKQTPAAIDAFEAAHTLDPNSEVCIRALTELYAASNELYGERGIALHLSRVHQDPFQAEPYKQLRRLYTGQRRADPAWCLCQVLNALGLSSPDEDQFYERLRGEGPAALQEPLSNDDWQALIHPDTDQLITAIFSALEGIVIAERVQSLEALGFAPETAVDTSKSEGSVAHVVVYTAQALGFGVPYVFDGPHLAEAVVPLPADVPAVALGLPLLDASVSAQSSVFVAARALCLLQPGFRLRHLLTSGTVLKAWLLAAVKFNSPAFPVPPELVGPVSDALAAIQQHLPPAAKDGLTRLVAKLIQEASELNLKKWIAAIDFTIDRVGFLLSNDLKVATESIAQSSAGEMAPSQDARLRELIFFAVSEPYFDLRRRLQLGIDG